MKILMLTDKMGLGGAETHILTLCTQLLKEENEITLISSGGAFADKLSDLGVKCVTAPFDKRDPHSIFKSMRILRSFMERCSLVHAHTRFTATLASFIRGRGCLPKIVTTAHLPFKKRGLGIFTRWGDHTLAVSQDIANHLELEYKIPAEKITLTRNGIDLHIFSPELRSPENIILHISRIDTDRAKTAFLLVDIADKISSINNGIKIVIAGDGDRFAELSQAVKKKNTQCGKEVVILTGGVSDVEKLLSRALIFVGVSRALLEAMAMGIPSIASGDEGYGGIVLEKSISMLERTNFCARDMQSANSKLLFSDIFRLINSDPLSKASSAAGLACVRERYSPEKFANDAKNVYKALLWGRSATLLGYFGFGNLGDEAICRASADALYERGIEKLIILSDTHNGGSQMSHKRVQPVYLDRHSPKKIFSALRNTDMLILPGGSLLQNETSLRSLIYYTSVMRLAKLFGRRIYMISSGVGALRGSLARLLAGSALRSCYFVGARTRIDLSVVRAFRKERRTALMPDACFAYYGGYSGVESRNIEITSSNAQSSKKRDSIAIIPSCKYYPSIDCIKGIEKYTGLSARIYIISPLSDKEAFNYYTDRGIPVDIPKNPEELMDKLSQCRISVCSRLHAGIFSLIAKTPCLLSAHSEKNRALIAELAGGHSERFIHSFYKEELEIIQNTNDNYNGEWTFERNSEILNNSIKERICSLVHISDEAWQIELGELIGYFSKQIWITLDELFGEPRSIE